MAEHFCKQHKTPWFSTQYGYGHPIVDEEGNPVLNDKGKQTWCREPKEEKKEATEATESPEKQASIEIQNAYTGVVSLMVSGVIKKTDQLGQTAINYAASKLERWASMGEVEQTKEPKAKSPEPKITKEQLAKIGEIIKGMNYPIELAQSIMIRECKVDQSKELTRLQAALFIEILLTGKFLEKKEPEELEPEDIPF